MFNHEEFMNSLKKGSMNQSTMNSVNNFFGVKVNRKSVNNQATEKKNVETKSTANQNLDCEKVFNNFFMKGLNFRR